MVARLGQVIYWAGVVVAFVMAANHAFAQTTVPTFFNGNQLFAACQEDRNICGLYASAAVDTMQLFGVSCVARVNATQMRDLFYQFLDTNPALRHMAAASLASEAVFKAGLCQRPPKR